MNLCKRCGTQHATGIRYCSRCGTATLSAGAGVNGAGMLAGVAAGSAISVVFIAFGLLLCLTGIGLVLGVPFILAGLVSPVMGLLKGAAAKRIQRCRGNCPWCAYTVTGSAPGFNCPACRNRILVRGNVFSKAPTA